MDFSLSKDQKELITILKEFCHNELIDDVKQKDKNHEFSYENWKKCSEFGLLSLALPEKYGGTGCDFLTGMLMSEAFGFACKDNGFVFAVNNHIWVCEIPILLYGTEYLKDKYLPMLSSGEKIGAYVLSEPEAGSDAFHISTQAVRKDDHYILNGSKTFITNAPIADVFIVLAVTDQNKNMGGLSAFVVEKDFPGFTMSHTIEKMGLRTSPMGELVFDNCIVPAENLLLKEGSGEFIINKVLEWERSFIFAGHVGQMEREMEECVNYVKERKQFGKPIGEFQSISNKIAEMKVDLELAKLILYKIGWMKDKNKNAFLDSSIAKLFISESLVKTSLYSMQIHGAYGYTCEFDIERGLRDSLSSTIYSGTSEIQKNIISKLTIGL